MEHFPGLRNLEDAKDVISTKPVDAEVGRQCKLTNPANCSKLGDFFSAANTLY